MADPDAALANMENLMRRYEEMRATGKIDGGDSDDDGSDAEGDVPDDFDEGGGWIDDGSDDGSDDDDDLDVDDAREDRELTPEEAKREFLVSECVRMLSSGAREKKFVGMLLATKIGDADARALERVARAKSFSPFLTSMLRAAPAPVTAEDLAGDDDDDATTTTMMKRETIEREREERARSSHALSLAACAALCRSPRVAARDDMLERLPLFINAMMRRGRYASISPAGVHDACEAVTAIVSSGKEDAEAIAAEGGALVACSIAIRDAAAETRGDGDGDGDGNGDENGGNPDADARFHPLLPAMTLLARLLEIPAIAAEIEVPGGVGVGGVDEKNQSRSREARAVAQATPALAAVVASRPGTPLAIEALRCLAMILSTLPARAAAGPSGGGLLSFELRRVARKSGGGERDGNQMLDDLRGRRRVRPALQVAAGDPPPRARPVRGGDVDRGPAVALSRRLRPRAAAAAGTAAPDGAVLYRLGVGTDARGTRGDAARPDARRSRAPPARARDALRPARDVRAPRRRARDRRERGGRRFRGGGGGKSLMSAETAHAAVTTLADAAGALIDFLELYAHSRRVLLTLVPIRPRSAWRTPILKGFTRRISPPTPRFRSPPSAPVNSRPDGSERHPDVRSHRTRLSGRRKPNDRFERRRRRRHRGERGRERRVGTPAVVLAVLRAASSFLAELPDAHERRVNALLPALLRGGGKGKGKGFGDDDDDGATVTTEATRSLSVRFLLPYLLQATETPAGLDAFRRRGRRERDRFPRRTRVRRRRRRRRRRRPERVRGDV